MTAAPWSAGPCPDYLFGEWEPVDELCYYDGLLSFSAMIGDQLHYLHCCDVGDGGQYVYMVRLTDPAAVADLAACRVSIRDFMLAPGPLWVTDGTTGAELDRAKMPADFLPVAGVVMYHKKPAEPARGTQT